MADKVTLPKKPKKVSKQTAFSSLEKFFKIRAYLFLLFPVFSLGIALGILGVLFFIPSISTQFILKYFLIFLLVCIIFCFVFKWYLNRCLRNLQIAMELHESY